MSKKLDFGREYKLHKFTQDHLKCFDLEFVASERQCDKLRADNIAFDGEKLVIIEYKNELVKQKVMDQAKEYYDLFKESTKNCDRLYKKDKKVCAIRLSDEEVFCSEEIRVIIIGPEFSKDFDNKYAFELWNVSLYDDGRIIYKNNETDELIKEFNVDKEELSYLTSIGLTEEKLLNKYKDAEILDLYSSFKEKVCANYDDVVLRFLSDGVSFRVNNQIACIVYFNKYSIKFHYNITELEGCEKLEEIPEEYNYVGNFELKLKPEEDIDCAFKLFEKVYKEKMEE